MLALQKSLQMLIIMGAFLMTGGMAHAEPSCLDRIDTVYQEPLTCENVYCKLLIYGQNSTASLQIYESLFAEAKTNLQRRHRDYRKLETGNCRGIQVEKNGESIEYCEAPEADFFMPLRDMAIEMNETRQDINENIRLLGQIRDELTEKVGECLGSSQESLSTP